MGSKRNVDMSASTDTVKHVEVKETPEVAEVSADAKAVKSTNEGAEVLENQQETLEAKKPSKKQTRSKKYVASRAKLDKTKLYSVAEAVKIVQELSYSKFDGTITADGMIREAGTAGNITFPHSTGQQRRVVILDDQVLADIEAGKIEFDILIAHPQYMPKLAKHARTLGPKGLMPNPKTGTLTPNPEAKKKELEAGTMTIKTEKKLPIIHMTVGKVSMKPEVIVENIEELIRVLGPKLTKLSISATMSPGVRVKIG